MGRDEEIAYARRHGIPVKGGTESAPYSIDDNLWGRSSEGKWIEDLSHAPDDDVFQLVTRPELAPDEAEVVTVDFERGVPVAIDGERLGLVALIERAAELGMRHGVGIVDHIEDRIVGLKVRDIYEVPAAAIILRAHRELERLTGTIHQNQFKPGLDQKWAYLVYAGLWWEPLRTDLEAYIDHVNERVTGTIGLKLFKGTRARRDAREPERRLRRAARDLLGVRRPVLPAGLAGLHRAVDAAVADRAAVARRPSVDFAPWCTSCWDCCLEGPDPVPAEKYGSATDAQAAARGGHRARGARRRCARLRASYASGDARISASGFAAAASETIRRMASSSPAHGVPGLVIEAVEWLPSGGDTGLVRVRGRWAGAAPRETGLPELGAAPRGGDAAVHVAARRAVRRRRHVWRATYVVGAALMDPPPDALWVAWESGARAALQAPARGFEPPPRPAAPAAAADGPAAR